PGGRCAGARARGTGCGSLRRLRCSAWVSLGTLAMPRAAPDTIVNRTGGILASLPHLEAESDETPQTRAIEIGRRPAGGAVAALPAAAESLRSGEDLLGR